MSQTKDAAMSAAANRKLIEQIFAAAGNPDPAARDRALFVASLADDATWVVTGQYSWSRAPSPASNRSCNDLHGHVRSLLVERARTIAHRFIADGDYVVVEARGDNVTQDRGPLRQRLLSGVPPGGREDQGGQGILRTRCWLSARWANFRPQKFRWRFERCRMAQHPSSSRPFRSGEDRVEAI